jgi:hypothetical protein
MVTSLQKRLADRFYCLKGESHDDMIGHILKIVRYHIAIFCHINGFETINGRKIVENHLFSALKESDTLTEHGDFSLRSREFTPQHVAE